VSGPGAGSFLPSAPLPGTPHLPGLVQGPDRFHPDGERTSLILNSCEILLESLELKWRLIIGKFRDIPVGPLLKTFLEE